MEARKQPSAVGREGEGEKEAERRESELTCGEKPFPLLLLLFCAHMAPSSRETGRQSERRRGEEALDLESSR